MKNHTHASRDALGSIQDEGRVNAERFAAAQKCTWVSVSINLLLTVLQLVVGYFGRSQALLADGLHSLSDLLSDFLVLIANRQGNRHADADHPYGHARFETAATLLLGSALATLGIILLVTAGMRLQHPEELQQVHPATFWVALLTLFAKEGLFRYLMAVAIRVRSQLLAANAWHSRSDAASSLVVLAGIGGNLLGFAFLDLMAAAVVGMMIARMGFRLALEALAELIDTGLDEKTVGAIRQTLIDTSGVRGLHDLRTRKMADNALVDAHILVDPRISVSEGHYIAESARQAVLNRHHVMDVLVHIDPEDDMQGRPNAHLPDRDSLLAQLAERLGDSTLAAKRVVLHYLGGKVEVELYLTGNQQDTADAEALQTRCDELVRDNELFRTIQVYRNHAQN
ncbi:MAG: cation diffusion facilitator family transporter [Gallionellales bacterium RIFCSPLOWO2_12_FULL_59_22]|nr:MAG: cation diffusion facilitator family transporter [Gallionellales bacterium RIFCSPLOWO2_02_FULL_59_110]OGT04155.1 MAG: cation diffusion facilitator family transporter [Gallionellales bacterium RIFCSPLOWO2_02_58_13]OGT10127.1 MAG: cation diffusion facilitator family transporter [Gallionellales bacterium RIFCSPLOWO2_12_FULL_59_22]